MKVELFPFQKRATSELRMKVAEALGGYRRTHTPQVISLQAPTGAGKTIIMASFVEDVYFGTDQYAEQPEAIFVWLSDSPALNEQSKQKIDLKADKIRFGQCVTIDDSSFDQEMLDDGHIYFLNTQKLSKTANLVHHSDTRQYTIWETLSNTVQEKSDRLYFIIDEAHRGMQGREAGKATSIMQRFLKGSPDLKLPSMPLVIGISATSARFNALVGDTNSTLQKCVISANEVRASGLLKDRIVITYPDDPEKHNDMAVLQAAIDEWKNKCEHWHQYTYEQHYANVNPVFVIQVLAGSGKAVSNTNMDDVISKIEERLNTKFCENEVVHTFGSTGTLTINGLNVPHIDPADITDDRRIKVVLFKENLSTGWDCPRAETMMSFRHAEDATYIAQLLGRMVRTPLQCHIMVDDSLNDVHLYLPYFNVDTVKQVIDELQSTEGGEIPTVIDGESLENQVYVPWTVHTVPKPKRKTEENPDQLNIFTLQTSEQSTMSEELVSEHTTDSNLSRVQENRPQQHSDIVHSPNQTPLSGNLDEQTENTAQAETSSEIDREGITKFINEQGYLTYIVRNVRINNYLKSLLNLTTLLTQYNICPNAKDEMDSEVIAMMHNYIEELHKNGKYDDLAKNVLSFKLAVRIFDVFGESLDNGLAHDLFTASDSDLDRQLRAADARLGAYGFTNKYGQEYADLENPSRYKVDCILFAADDDCVSSLYRYAEKKFHELNDNYRKYIVSKDDRCKKQYDSIVSDSDTVSKHNFSLPETISVRLEDGGEEYDNHLFADENGLAKIKLNGWEQGVLEEEMKSDDFVCWIRNPSRGSWSLCIPYEIENEIKPAYPDFIIVRKDSVLGYVIDILEPHNPDFKDNLAKAKGFAKYAAEEFRIGRVQIIRQGQNSAGKTRFKRLDLAKGAIRDKVLKAQNSDEFDHIFDTDGIFE